MEKGSTMKKTIVQAVISVFMAFTITTGVSVSALAQKELSLAYFMGPKHPMNKGLMKPFGDKLAALSGGKLIVKQYPGGALNSVPPKQYSIMLNGVADIVFMLPGYTSDLFPKTNVITLPGVCNSATDCTAKLQRARPELEKEYKAKVIALWANASPVLITRKNGVRSLADLKGMKIRVTAKSDAPVVASLGASPVFQPVTVINQNLANGVIDGIMIGPSAIGSFKLHEAGKFVTTWFPGSGSAFALLMNLDVYKSLSSEQQSWIDEASNTSLSMGAGKMYDKAAKRGLNIAKKSGLEMIELSHNEKAKIQAKVDKAMVKIVSRKAGNKTVSEIIDLMHGK